VSGLTRGGAILVIFTLMTALTGVAWASPHRADAGDGRGDVARPRRRMGAGRMANLRSATRSFAPLPGIPSAAAALAARVANHAAVTAADPGVVGVSAFQPTSAGAPRARRAAAAAMEVTATVTAAAALQLPSFSSPGDPRALTSPFGTKPLHAAVHLALPISLTMVVLVFLIAQSQIDRREPKLTRAQLGRDDDTMSFE
jgi:hypothetical protein